MKRRLLPLAFFAAVLASAFFAGSAYGHGLGEDQAVPLSVGERQITVMAKIDPAAVPFDPSVSPPTLLIRAHDENNNATISGIDYRVVIELRNETLLDQRFRSSDGIILANLVPDQDIEGWQITGHESAAPEDQVEVSLGSPVEIRSNILASGGLYHLKIILESTSTGLALQGDLEYDLYISVAHDIDFVAETPEGEREIIVKTYYDDVRDFAFKNGTISFAMPFNWNTEYVNQVSVVHMEVQFPKSIESLRTNSYNGTLNGVNLPAASIQIDDYSSEQDRIVHFVIPGSQLADISEDLEDEDSNTAVFTLGGTERPRFPMDLLSAPSEKYLMQLSWGPDVIETGIPITFVMNIRDAATDEVLRRPAFDLVLEQGGTELYRKSLQPDFGGHAETYTFSQPGTVTFSANDINGEGESVKIDLVVLQGTSNPPPQQQPPQQPSGCLIATAAYGSELSPQVQYLRNFREQYILSTAAGSAFMNTFNSAYYSFSPQVADYEREQPWLQSIVKAGLYPLFGILTLSEKAHFGAGGGEGGAVLAGATASSLIGATYLVPAGLAVTRRIQTRWIVISIGVAVAFLFVTMAVFPALLPASTAAFVVVFAGAAALFTARLLLRIYRRGSESA